MTTTSAPPALAQGSAGRAGDKFFSGLTLAAGILILAVLAFVAGYLVVQAAPALFAPADQIASGEPFFKYVLPIMIGTLITAAISLLLATPVAIGVALFISHLAPRKLAKPVAYVVDLLAAIPSIVYGAWGMIVLGPHMVPLYNWLHQYLGWIPLFGEASATGRTLMTASVVLAVMVLPIITALSREIFVQTPKLHEEAALALGATRWEMIKMSVLPFARPGVVSAVMLGLGRALGETMAVTLVLSPGLLTANLIGSGNQTIPSEIALNFPEAFGMRQHELIAAGLILFVITLLVNMAARWIVNRSKVAGGN